MNFLGLTFRGPGDSFVCIRERAYRGGMRWRDRCSSFLFIMTNFVYSIKIYKFTVQNKYHYWHHAMKISVRTPPYNFVMLYICKNSKIIFCSHFIQKECCMRNKREEWAC